MDSYIMCEHSTKQRNRVCRLLPRAIRREDLIRCSRGAPGENSHGRRAFQPSGAASGSRRNTAVCLGEHNKQPQESLGDPSEREPSKQQLGTDSSSWFLRHTGRSAPGTTNFQARIDAAKAVAVLAHASQARAKDNSSALLLKRCKFHLRAMYE